MLQKLNLYPMFAKRQTYKIIQTLYQEKRGERNLLYKIQTYDMKCDQTMKEHTEENRLKSSKSLVESPSYRRRKIVAMIRLGPPLGSTESRFVLLVCDVNILQKHVCVCVCALWHIRGYDNGEEKHKIWNHHQSL